MNREDLAAELVNDPLGWGYEGTGVFNVGPGPLSSQEVANVMNTLHPSPDDRSVVREVMSRSEIMQSIDPSEFDGKSDGQKADIWGVLGVDNVDPRPGSFEEHIFIAVFTAGSVTLNNLVAARKKEVSRSEELLLGRVRAGHVEEARE